MACVGQAAAEPAAFFAKHCVECHNSEDPEAGLDLVTLKQDLADPDLFARWVKVYDRIASGEMPPKGQPHPPEAESAEITTSLKQTLLAADRARLHHSGSVRTPIRRLTRGEYECTLRDLFGLPGLSLQGELPADGMAYGFDKNGDALDVSHVNLSKYIDAAEQTLDLAIAVKPQQPIVRKQRISLANKGSGVAHVLLYGEAVMLKDRKPDPDFPPPKDYMHIDQGAHEEIGMYQLSSSVGLFRPEDESFQPYFLDFATLYPGNYRIRTSLWSFQWDKGEVLPSRGTEVARLSAVKLNGDGRHTGHPSYLLGYYDAPSLEPQVHEIVTWLNYKETIGFNTASLAPGAHTRGKGGAYAFTGPGIACDWLEIEGPLHEAWPPQAHRTLFGDLPLQEFKSEEHTEIRPPRRAPLEQQIIHVLNRPDPVAGTWTVHSEQPVADADRLLAAFLPKAFRRPVEAAVRKQYLAKFEERRSAGDCFETALRWAYRAALCSPDFLYHYEPAGELDDHALACRLSYLFWNSLPDDTLTQLANSGRLRESAVLRGQVERLLQDPKSNRFVEEFLGQWLKLRQIATNDPDKKLYPEFNPYLQDSMLAETRAYFRELLDKNLGVDRLVRSEFVMINERLASHYHIPGVTGSQIRRVPLPADCPRGGFLTQAAVLKVTANGTTTSPVPRGAFVAARILGQPPEPPPPNVPAIEPDVRGTKSIRDQLEKHRSDAVCASCHAKIDPPGFALESFDVIGGFRTRYRSIGTGDPLPAGFLDPYMGGAEFRLGPAVDASGVMPDGRTFAGIGEFQSLLAADSARLLKNLAQQFAVYALGRDIAFSDRDEIDAIVKRTQDQGGGIRTLLDELTQSNLFRTR